MVDRQEPDKRHWEVAIVVHVNTEQYSCASLLCIVAEYVLSPPIYTLLATPKGNISWLADL